MGRAAIGYIQAGANPFAGAQQVKEKRTSRKKTSIYIEDALIIVSIALLFWLGVLERNERWAQLLMGGVLLVMLTVFIRRIRRVHGAFTGSENDSADGDM